jgi:N-acetylglutamate synthase-like GNAT family acetyltransferase
MIRKCTDSDFEKIYEIINEASNAYRGVIPDDRWKEPYMPRNELQSEINAGVNFSGYEVNGELVAVMGIQNVKDVTLIRHAYTRTAEQGKGYGKVLLKKLTSQTCKPILIGTWADSYWAISFYEKNGFCLTSSAEKDVLLKKYWAIPERQIATSVVLSDTPVVNLLEKIY